GRKALKAAVDAITNLVGVAADKHRLDRHNTLQIEFHNRTKNNVLYRIDSRAKKLGIVEHSDPTTNQAEEEPSASPRIKGSNLAEVYDNIRIKFGNRERAAFSALDRTFGGEGNFRECLL